MFSTLLSKRIVLNIIALVSLLFFPWWATLLVGIVGTIFLDYFYELVVLGILLDVLYGIPSPSPVWIPLPIIHTVLFTLIYMTIVFVKGRMR